MGVVELWDDRLVIQAFFIFYGKAASAELSVKIADDIQKQWNKPEGVVMYKSRLLPVLFKISGIYQPFLTDIEVIANLDPRKNFFRIEEFSKYHISYVDGIGCNSGYFKLDNLLDGSTTAAHEFGHTLGLHHPKVLDIRGKGVPGIMYPRGTITDPLFQYDPKAKPLDQGGTLNPFKRVVTQRDIDMLNISKLHFENNKAIVGAFSSVFHEQDIEE
ncbi:MAG: peptidase M10 [Ferruginibacter sp.]|nr:peptidase M10 [Ferruginibacter sp.]